MNPEQRLAADASSLLNSPAYKAAMTALKDKLDANIAGVNPDNKDQCARVVLAVQLLGGIEREIKRFVSDGEVADLIELDEVRQLNMKERVSGRIVR